MRNVRGEIDSQVKRIVFKQHHLNSSFNWVFQWSWHTWVRFNTDLFRVKSRFIYQWIGLGTLL